MAFKRWFVAAAVAIAPCPAFGHDAAQWIADGAYKTLDGRLCCGTTDCAPIPEQMVHRVYGAVGGWEVEGDFFADADIGHGLHPSIDGSFWRCKYEGRPARCLFVLPEGA